MHTERSIPERKRLVSREDHERNGHFLVEIAERVPGDEPTNVARSLTDSPTYSTRYWRCRHCGQERNRLGEFTERCAASAVQTPRADGGYSIEEPRTRDALSADMTVQPTTTPGVYEVHEEDSVTQAVDVDAETCTCRDRTPGGAYCKHLRRVDVEIRTGTVPGPES